MNMRPPGPPPVSRVHRTDGPDPGDRLLEDPEARKKKAGMEPRVKDDQDEHLDAGGETSPDSPNTAEMAPLYTAGTILPD